MHTVSPCRAEKRGRDGSSQLSQVLQMLAGWGGSGEMRVASDIAADNDTAGVPNQSVPPIVGLMSHLQLQRG